MTAVEPDIRELSTKVAAASEPFRRLLVQMHRVIVGQDELLHRMLVALLSRGHVLDPLRVARQYPARPFVRGRGTEGLPGLTCKSPRMPPSSAVAGHGDGGPLREGGDHRVDGHGIDERVIDGMDEHGVRTRRFGRVELTCRQRRDPFGKTRGQRGRQTLSLRSSKR